MNENFEKYIKDLSPELQEKARACKTKDELLQLAADEDMEIPMDALESVAGGCGGGTPAPKKPAPPRMTLCKIHNIEMPYLPGGFYCKLCDKYYTNFNDIKTI